MIYFCFYYNLKEEVGSVVNESKLDFCIFLLYSLAEEWKKTPAEVYQVLNSTGILDEYVIPCYDVLHTLGKDYLVEDITEFVREKMCLEETNEFS